MSGKTSKFLRRWATHAKLRNRHIKRAWYQTPRLARNRMKSMLEMEMNPPKPFVLEVV